MKLTKTLLLFVALAASLKSGAQSQFDFIQYNMHQLYTNAAQTGAYEGTYRVGGIYRSQWNAGPGAVYQPLSVFIDAPLLLIAKRHWVGAGVQLDNDVAGTANQTTRIIGVSGAFHFALDKRYKNVISLGTQFGVGSIGLDLDPQKLYLPSELTSGKPGLRPFADKKTNYNDLNVGLLFKSVIDKASSFELGFSFNNLIGAKKSLVGATTKESKNRFYFATNASYNRKINSRGSIHPSILIQKQTLAFTVKPQLLYGYKMAKKGTSEPIIMKAGVGYAINGNQAQIILGADYKDLKFGFGYGINTSSLKKAEDNSLEFAVQYIGKKYKNPKVKPVMVCPKY